MVRNIAFVLFCTASQLLSAPGGVPCSIQRAAAAGANLWILCDRDQLLASTDNGATWQTRSLPSGSRFRSIAFIDERRGFIAGDAGTLLGTTDGGATWQPVQVPTGENLTDITFAGENGWIAGWSGLVLNSRDGGKTWVQQQSGIRQGLEDIYFADADHGWAAGWIGVIIRTTDGGKSWQKAQTPEGVWSLNSIWFRDANNGWAVGFEGQILRSRDGGATWEKQKSPVQTWLRSVAFDSSGRGWMTTDNELLVSEDRGETWRSVPVEAPAFLKQVLPLQDSVWVLGQFSVWKQTGRDIKLTAVSTLPQDTLPGQTGN